MQGVSGLTNLAIFVVYLLEALCINETTTNKLFFLRLKIFCSDNPLEAITTAIETGWEMAGVYEEAIMKFHPDTNLLVFRGGREAVDVVYSVFGQLETPTSDSEKGSESEDDK